MHSFTFIRYFWQSTVMEKGVKNGVHFFVVNDGARGLGMLGVIKDAGINVGTKSIQRCQEETSHDCCVYVGSTILHNAMIASTARNAFFTTPFSCFSNHVKGALEGR